MILNDFKFSILLSTFNGELYIEQFLKSIANQSYRDFILIIRDDGSTDSTSSIVNKWINLNLFQIKFEKGVNIGWRSSFNKMLKDIDGSYFLFADQDDIWDSNKLYELNSIIIQDNIKSDDIFLISHNANIIDINNNILKNNVLLGYNSYESIKNRIECLSGGLYGCTILFTNGLRIKTHFLINHDFIAHDHKCLIIAHYYGDIKHLNFPLISWRKHNNSSSVNGIAIYISKIYAIFKLSLIESKFSNFNFFKLFYFKIYFLIINYLVK
jgi:glycosyltransferase involved in cell wall biosynthesis